MGLDGGGLKAIFKAKGDLKQLTTWIGTLEGESSPDIAPEAIRLPTSDEQIEALHRECLNGVKQSRNTQGAANAKAQGLHEDIRHAAEREPLMHLEEQISVELRGTRFEDACAATARHAELINERIATCRFELDLLACQERLPASSADLAAELVVEAAKALTTDGSLGLAFLKPTDLGPRHMLGDLDSKGIEIPVNVNHWRVARGLQPIEPEGHWYRWLLRQGRRCPCANTEVSPESETRGVQWFGETLWKDVRELLLGGHRIPQEALELEALIAEEG